MFPPIEQGDPLYGPPKPKEEPIVNANNDPGIASNILRFMAGGNTPTEMARQYTYLPMVGGGSAFPAPPPAGGNEMMTLDNNPNIKPPARIDQGRIGAIDPLSKKPIKPLDNPIGYGPKEAYATLKDLVPRETSEDGTRTYTEYGGPKLEISTYLKNRDVPFWYDMAALNALRTTVHNIAQRKPDYINLKTASLPRVRHNAVPWDTGRKMIKDSGQQALGVGKGQVRSVSDYINMVNAVTAGQIKGANELAAGESQASQQVDVANAQIGAQEETTNVQIKNQEKITNYQIQQQHAQLRQEGIDKGIGAFISNKAQRADYLTKQEAAKQQASVDAMSVAYMAQSMRYENASTSEGLQSFLGDKSNEAIQKLQQEMGAADDFDSPYMAKKKEAAISNLLKDEKDMEYYKAYETQISAIDDAVKNETKTQEIADKEKEEWASKLEAKRQMRIKEALQVPDTNRGVAAGPLYNQLVSEYSMDFEKKRKELYDDRIPEYTQEWYDKNGIERPDITKLLANLSKVYNFQY